MLLAPRLLYKMGFLNIQFLKMQMKCLLASQLLFEAILTALLNLELNEWLFAMGSDPERFTSKYHLIYVQNIDALKLFFKDLF